MLSFFWLFLLGVAPARSRGERFGVFSGHLSGGSSSTYWLWLWGKAPCFLSLCCCPCNAGSCNLVLAHWGSCVGVWCLPWCLLVYTPLALGGLPTSWHCSSRVAVMRCFGGVFVPCFLAVGSLLASVVGLAGGAVSCSCSAHTSGYGMVARNHWFWGSQRAEMPGLSLTHLVVLGIELKTSS